MLAESLNDQPRLGQVSAYLTAYFVQAGDDLVQAIEKGQRALTIASAIDDLSLKIQANHFLGSAYYRRGEYDRAIEHFRGNVDSLVGDQIYERFGLVFLASVGSRYQLVLLFSDRGEFTDASIHANEVVRIAEAVNHPYNLYTAYFAVGYMHLRKGAIDKAITALEHSLDLCRSWNIPTCEFPRPRARSKVTPYVYCTGEWRGPADSGGGATAAKLGCRLGYSLAGPK